MHKINIRPLDTIDGETLMSLPTEPPNFVVDSLLSQGLHILAGAPKVGKSWLALWLATTIAKGEPVWGLQTRQGTTLYLCLEDSTRRIQNRLFSITDEVPSSVHFCTESSILEKGLEEQLTQFLEEHPNTVLIMCRPRGRQRASPLAVHRRLTGRLHTAFGISLPGGSPDPLTTLNILRRYDLKKEANRTKPLALTFRVTEADAETIRRKAEAAGMDLTKYLTACAVGKEIVHIDGLNDFTRALRQQGTNLNQLATLANMGRIRSVNVGETYELYLEIQKQLKEILERKA